MKKTLIIIVIALSLISLTSGQPQIHLKQGSFTPDETRPDFSLQSQTRSQHTGYKLLQFKEPTTKDYREELSEHLEFISYIPENAWLVELKSGRNEIVSEEKVKFLGPYRPEYKISPSLKQNAEKNSGNVELRVELFSKGSKETLEEYGGLEKYGSKTWSINTSYSEVDSISSEDAVRWISQTPPKPTTFNDEARKLIGAQRLQQSPYNLKGEGFTAGVWDGGEIGEHSDVNYTGKLFLGETSSVSDHATHVAGTLAGNGNITYSYRGVAPKTSLASYDFDFATLSEFYNEIEDSIISYNANLSQNSWGWTITSSNKGLMGNYGGLADEYDEVVRGDAIAVSDNYPIIFSAGNEGFRTPRYNTTTGPGATAKNTISVGAVDDSAGMTVYTSWGPTDDGRIKPTVMANGGKYCDQINSTIPGNTYGGKCGTSMASPAVSGTVILFQQKYNETYSEIPEPSTVKAALIHTAEDLDRKGPDYKTGWGLVNATKAIDFVNKSDDRQLIKRGELTGLSDSDGFTVTVPKGGTANFTLVWSDYPGTSPSGGALINDLDLVVENADGERKYPWTLSWENRTDPALQTQEDHTNPLEQVSVSSTETKKYNITVEASSLPEPSQSYSLLMSSNSAPTPEMDVLKPDNTSYSVKPDFRVSVNDAVESVNYSVNDENYTLTRENSTFLYNNSVDVEGQKTATFYAENLNGYTISEVVSFTVDTEAPELNVESPVNFANVSGNFSLNASWYDETSEVVDQEFKLYNQGFSLQGNLNNTLNSSELQDGSYNVSFNVTDSLGNYNQTTRNITVDNTRPNFNFLSLNDSVIKTSGRLDVDAAWSDAGTGVKSSSFLLENSTWSFPGSPNGTVYEADLSDSVYNLTYTIEDYAGNVRSEKEEVLYDTEAPSLKVSSPENDSFASVNFSVRAVFEDSVSGIEKANYSVLNDSTVLSGQLNDTTDTSNLSEDEYKIEYTAYDKAGRMNYTSVNVTLDDSPPTLNLSSPEDGQLLSGNFSINATYSDDVGVETTSYELSNGSVQKSGELNATLNSSEFKDGSYNLSVNVSDTAGNVNNTLRNLEFDNSAPKIKNAAIDDNANISGVVDVNYTFEERTDVELSEFRMFNQSGNVTEWKDLNYTDLNTSEFEEGQYNFSLRLNDSLGNFKKQNLSSITIDNTDPELQVKEFNLTEERNGWVKDNKTVELSCSDSLSKVEQLSSPSNSSSLKPVNFTVNQSGKQDYSFVCKDYSGNKDEKTFSFSIDTEAPELQSLSPEDGAKTGRTVDVTAEFFNESKESGMNTSASSVSLSGGSSDTDLSNSSLEVDVSDLEYSESFSLDATLVDRVGHDYSFSADYNVEEEPEDDSGGGSGGGGGGGFGSPSDDSEEENEIDNSTLDNETDTEEADNSTNQTDSVNNDTEDDEGDSCSVSAVDSEGSVCREFNSCSIPDSWREVESCSSWQKQRAQELIEQLENDDEEIVSEARSEFEKGNYSGAITKALEAKESQRDDVEPGLVQKYGEALIVVAAVTLLTSVVLYRRRRKQRILSEVEEYSGRLEDELRENGLTKSEKKEFAEASEDIEQEKYKDALAKLKDISPQ